MRQGQNRLGVADMAYIALFAAVIAICSWMAIPAAVPFTLQTLGVFLAVGVLGGRRGTLAVLVYLLLGAIGLPVFSGFEGGLGKLLGATGGYIIGFVGSALVMWAMERLPLREGLRLTLSMVLGLVVCYAFGTAWFMQVYAQQSGEIGLTSALTMCVFPFVVPDLIKIGLAQIIAKRLKAAVRLR